MLAGLPSLFVSLLASSLVLAMPTSYQPGDIVLVDPQTINFEPKPASPVSVFARTCGFGLKKELEGG